VRVGDRLIDGASEAASSDCGISSSRAPSRRSDTDGHPFRRDHQHHQVRDRLVRRGVETRSVGTVVEVGDGIAQIYGLDGALASELLEFPRA
jgi:hypothetical protein